MQAELSTAFPPATSEGGARRRRPGSRRSTSAWTVYVGAGLLVAADPSKLPRVPSATGSAQWQSPSSLAGDAKRPLGFPAGGTRAVAEPISALPGRRGSMSSVDNPKRAEACPGLKAWVVHGCSTFSARLAGATR